MRITGTAPVLGKTCIHAVRAVVQLARLPRGTSLGAAQIAKEIGAPPNYLGKLLHKLADRGIVEPRKGFGGGYRLVRDAGTVRLLDVVESIEPIDRYDNCLLGQPRCSDENPCVVHTRWTRVRDDYRAMLTETSIADLI